MVATWGNANALPTTFPLHDCWALRRGELHEITDPAHSAQCRHFSHPPSVYLCIPLTVRGETFGLLHISADEAITEDQFRELRILALTVSESIKLALSNIKLQEALREQAIRDPLTGLFNRRYLDETLPRELHRCQRQGEPLAAAMLDVDHFKRFNDAYGHEAGDAVLRAMGDLLNHSLRGGDIACRYGGEELTVILPGSTLEDARMRLDRMRQAIMHMRVLYQGGDLPVITVSIGVAAGEQEMDAAALLGRADAALYQAKADGRNRVISG
ncbi:MAG: GGDEF domain-containing protein [Synechococcaceae cyanobacterium SM1_2_3]|nr:GGDEF domain-containing protein [Synechococcaceae cyanobacterium SM1_2_3]